MEDIKFLKNMRDKIGSLSPSAWQIIADELVKLKDKMMHEYGFSELVYNKALNACPEDLVWQPTEDTYIYRF